jgi:hypothetical protein
MQNSFKKMKVAILVTDGGGMQPVKFAPFFLNLYVKMFLVTDLVTDV